MRGSQACAEAKDIRDAGLHLAIRVLTNRTLFAGSCPRILRIIPEASLRGTIPPFQHEMRGRCYDSTPVFLPARADRLGVGIPDALRAVAVGARCRSTDTTHASHATPQALMRPPTLYRPDP